MTNESFSIRLVNPTREFGTAIETALLASGVAEDAKAIRSLDHPLRAFILIGSGDPHEQACAFLAAVALRSRSGTGDTVRTYAEALVVWLQYLNSQEILLGHATEEDLGLFRAHLASSRHGANLQPYQSTTINNRLAVAAQFHIWGQRRARMCSPLGEFLLDVRSNQKVYAGNHEKRTSNQHAIGFPREGRLPRLLNQSNIKRLFTVMKTSHRTLFRWGLVTGARRFEVCSLKISDLPGEEQVGSAEGGLIPLAIMRKGSRKLTLQVPASLIEETRWYILTERPAPKDSISAQYVFLNSRGRPVARGQLSADFRQYANSIGLDATLHHLRHTFAVNVLSVLESFESDENPMNPIKTLQVLLGHANISTTETYLRAVQASSPAVVEALGFLYGATL